MVKRYGLKRLQMVKEQYLYLLYQQEIIVKLRLIYSKTSQNLRPTKKINFYNEYLKNYIDNCSRYNC